MDHRRTSPPVSAKIQIVIGQESRDFIEPEALEKEASTYLAAQQHRTEPKLVGLLRGTQPGAIVMPPFLSMPPALQGAR
jgi:hypothetical protein